jgi:hypothetical protein
VQSNVNEKLFIPRSEYHVFPLDIPPLSRKERSQAVENKLRGLFPEKLDDKCIVVLPNGKRGSYVSLVFSDSLQDDPLSVSTLVAAKLCKKGRRNCVIAWEDWIEYIVLEDGKILSSMVTKGEGQLIDLLTEQAMEWFDITENPVIEVFCTVDNHPKEPVIEIGEVTFKFINLEKALASLPRSYWSCFPERLPQVKIQRRLAAVAVLAAALIITFSIRDWYKKIETENAVRREAARLLELAEQNKKAKEALLATLKAAWEERLTGQHIGIYKTMEILSSCLSPTIRLFSAAMKEDGNFRLEGSAYYVISALEDLQSHPEIHNAAIGTIIWDEGQQRFTVNGLVQNTPLFPEESLPDDEKIAWYEAVLAHSDNQEALPETAATAAKQVQDLLEQHHLRITRFRYLEELAAHGKDIQTTPLKGWTIECSVSGSGFQLIRALKEADSANSLRITTLETRNRQNGLDAVLTFFVRGPGEERLRRNYETHPSLARIASLYGILPASSPSFEQRIPFVDTVPPANLPRVSTFSGSLEYVGYIGMTEGRRYIYVKDTKTSELFRLIEGDGNNSYKVSAEGVITAKIFDSSNPIEVRRNDGF